MIDFLMYTKSHNRQAAPILSNSIQALPAASITIQVSSLRLSSRKCPKSARSAQGGRYNELASLYTTKKLPGVGASIGLDRLLVALDALGRVIGRATRSLRSLSSIKERAKTAELHAIAAKLRNLGVSAEVYPRTKETRRPIRLRREKGHPLCAAPRRIEPFRGPLSIARSRPTLNHRFFELRGARRLPRRCKGMSEPEIQPLTSGTSSLIRTFVVRSGRMTEAQRMALDEYGPNFIIPYQSLLVDPATFFAVSKPLVVEIGFGMGQATWQIAAERTQYNYLGIEVHSPGVGRLIMEIRDKSLENLKIIQHDAVEVLADMIPEKSLCWASYLLPRSLAEKAAAETQNHAPPHCRPHDFAARAWRIPLFCYRYRGLRPVDARVAIRMRWHFQLL